MAVFKRATPEIQEMWWRFSSNFLAHGTKEKMRADALAIIFFIGKTNHLYLGDQVTVTDLATLQLAWPQKQPR